MRMPCIDFASTYATVPLLLDQREQHYYARTNPYNNKVGTAAVSMLTQLLAATGNEDVAVIYSAPLGGIDAKDAFQHDAGRLGVRVRAVVELELSVNTGGGGSIVNGAPAYNPIQLARQMDAVRQSGCKVVVLILPEHDEHAAATAVAGGGRSQLYTTADRL